MIGFVSFMAIIVLAVSGMKNTAELKKAREFTLKKLRQSQQESQNQGGIRIHDDTEGGLEDYMDKLRGLPEYNTLICVLSGTAMIAALVSAMAGKWIFVAIGLIVSIAVTFSYLKEAKELAAQMKIAMAELRAAGEGTIGMTRYQPWYVWLRIAKMGMGFWMKLIMYFTLIGIPVVRKIGEMADPEEYCDEGSIRASLMDMRDGK